MLRYNLTLAAMLLVVGLVCAQTPSSRWVYLGTTQHGNTTLYIATDLRTVSNGNKIGWSKYADKDGKSVLERAEYDCKTGKRRIFDQIDYDKAGVVTNSASEPAPSWDAVVPESAAEAMLNHVCGTTKPSAPLPLPPPARSETVVTEYGGTKSQPHLIRMAHMGDEGLYASYSTCEQTAPFVGTIADVGPEKDGLAAFRIATPSKQLVYFIYKPYVAKHVTAADMTHLAQLLTVGHRVRIMAHQCTDDAAAPVRFIDEIRLIESRPSPPRSTTRTVETIKTGIHL